MYLDHPSLAFFSRSQYHIGNMKEEKKRGRGSSPNSRKNLKPVEKGEVRNPEGSRAHDPYRRELKKFTSTYLTEVIDAAVMGNLEALQAIVKNPKSPAIQVGVARVLYNGIRDGDWDIIEKILARIIGKVPDKIDHTTGGQPMQKIIKLEFVDDGLPD